MPLPEAQPDGCWIRHWRGRAGELRTLLGRAAGAGAEADELRRLEAAQRLLGALDPGEGCQVWLDRRQPEAGALLRLSRRGHFQHRHLALPWLVIRSPQRELRLVRYAHRRTQRSFSAGQLVSAARGADLDELQVLGEGGAARRPVPELGRLEVDLEELSAGTPLARGLPATAAHPATAQRGAVLAGSLLALALLVVTPLGLGALARPRTPPTRSLEQGLASLSQGGAPAAVDSAAVLPPREAQPLARAASRARDTGLRQRGLALVARVLPRAERRARLVLAARGDPQLRLRLLALDLLRAEGDLGATALARLHADPGAPLQVRQQAFRLLRDRDDPRVPELALRGLVGQAPPALWRTWASALPADRTTLEALLRHPDAHVRALSAWGLSALPGAQEPLWSELDRAQDPFEQVAVARGLVRAGAPPADVLARLPGELRRQLAAQGAFLREPLKSSPSPGR